MIFKDEVSIEVKAGKGGAGAATFRREKYVPKGGPDGGDGGDGGNVIIRVNPHLRTLSYIHNFQKFKAEDGGSGMSKQKFGRKGASFPIEVPAGTLVIDEETGAILTDLTENNSELIAVKGGIGGKGNVHFKSSTNQTPFYAQKGRPGEIKKIQLELKMIAHIGLVGFPNAGKSTLVSKITNARPKIAAYPFTTLSPNIGVMTIDDAYTSILIADIPGLIEGAHKGKGLGIDFLKHIERTKVILFILDAFDNPLEKFKILRQELKSYSEVLYKRDYMIALNKIDLIFDDSEKKELKKVFSRITKEVYLISALTNISLSEFKIALYKKYSEIEEKENIMEK
jgi:GTP-binding protein